MEIPGISSNNSLSQATGLGGSAIGKDAFMELLVTQLKNQDPMEPTKNTEMIAQLAQFSSLEQMQEVNDNIVGLAVLQQGNALLSQLTSSSALINQNVKYVDPNTQLESWGRVASVKIEGGLALLNIGGADVPLANVIEIGPAGSESGTGE